VADDSQGTVCVFAGFTYTVTNAGISESTGELDGSHIGQTAGSYRLSQAAPLYDPDEVTFSYLGKVRPKRGATGTITVGNYTGSATVTNSSSTFSVGELVQGNVTFKVIPTYTATTF
jgi:hypothetical protein